MGAARSGSYLELHLSSLSLEGAIDLPARFGAAIRELGGDYSECRGDRSSGTRFVTVPATAEGAALAVDLLRRYPNRWGKRPGVVVLGRPRGGECLHGHAPIGREEETIAAMLGGTRGAALRVELDAEERRQAEIAARPARLRAERAALLARLAEIDAELGGAA